MMMQSHTNSGKLQIGALCELWYQHHPNLLKSSQMLLTNSLLIPIFPSASHDIRPQEKTPWTQSLA